MLLVSKTSCNLSLIKLKAATVRNRKDIGIKETHGLVWRVEISAPRRINLPHVLEP
tara:strand:+ start:412 stop:579 length:168 start_codon:yes stop_codon:yes gene_type:complete